MKTPRRRMSQCYACRQRGHLDAECPRRAVYIAPHYYENIISMALSCSTQLESIIYLDKHLTIMEMLDIFDHAGILQRRPVFAERVLHAARILLLRELYGTSTTTPGNYGTSSRTRLDIS